MKKLIAAAVAAAVIAPLSVMASGPVMYGKIQMSVNYLDNGGSNSAGTKYNESSLNSNHSRIGIKGSEDLGNGMKVGYLIEWGVDMDGDGSKAGGGGDTSGLSERNRAVTLSGAWGTALAGKWDTPLKTIGRKVDLFPERLGDNRNMNTRAVLDARTANTLAYVTPNMGGFSSTIAYVFDVSPEDGMDDSDGDAFSINGIYNNGPLLLALAYESISEDAFGLFSSEDQEVWRLAGSYAFGGIKMLASYTDISDGFGVNNNDFYIWTLGSSYSFGNNTVKLQFNGRDDGDFSDNFHHDTPIEDRIEDEGAAWGWAIGLDHAMSKRTTVYVEYGAINNDDDSNAVAWNTMGNGASAGTNSSGTKFKDNSGFGVGIIHKF